MPWESQPKARHNAALRYTRWCSSLCCAPFSARVAGSPRSRGFRIFSVGTDLYPLQDICPSVRDTAAGALDYTSDSIVGLATPPHNLIF
ncbi:hypothetical protein NDU88_003604 [Pleurodeles waltl]|uniref:Uncharacterized protein n=1 Tax=Pleurodeles waltl TaxID=8319 RepID=A0AAV7MR29_PLEWA|nr:hypothetical protein NDU88_003604 [Pleurodeles waltl]